MLAPSVQHAGRERATSLPGHPHRRLAAPLGATRQVTNEPGQPGNQSRALSTREHEILDGVAQGLSNKEIGSRLDLSALTVKNHLARIFKKLQVRSRTAAAMASLPSRLKRCAPGPKAKPPDMPLEKRIAREHEILDGVAQGLSNKEIGSRLDLSAFTVKNHLARIFKKLQVRSRTAAAMASLPSRPERCAPRPGANPDMPPESRMMGFPV